MQIPMEPSLPDHSSRKNSLDCFISRSGTEKGSYYCWIKKADRTLWLSPVGYKKSFVDKTVSRSHLNSAL